MGETAAAEEITHDTFLRAHAAYQRVRPLAGSERTWLISIARNLSLEIRDELIARLSSSRRVRTVW